MGLVALGLVPVLGRVGRRHGQQVHGADLVGAADGVQHPLAAARLLRLALGVHLHLDDVARRVGDDDAQRVGHARGRVGADDADLHLGHAQAPGARAEAVEEALQRLLHLLRLQREDGREVEEHVVEVRVVVADDLERVEDVRDDAVRLGDEVLGRGDLVAQPAGPDGRAREVALVDLGALADGLVHVDVLVLGEDGLDVELGQLAELELEGQGRLRVADAVVLVVVGAAERVVAGVGAVLAAADERQPADAARQQLVLVLGHERLDSVERLAVAQALGIADGHVDDGRELVRVVVVFPPPPQPGGPSPPEAPAAAYAGRPGWRPSRRSSRHYCACAAAGLVVVVVVVAVRVRVRRPSRRYRQGRPEASRGPWAGAPRRRRGTCRG